MELTVSSSPHIRSGDSTRRIMIDVLISLAPALAAGVIFFGLRALALALVSVAAAVAAEWLWRRLAWQYSTISDCSAAVTGLLLALTLPATVPYWTAALGAAFAVVVVKGCFGGLGQNVFNPALAARALLLLCFPAAMTRFAVPGAQLPLLGAVDTATAATPLHTMVMPALPEQSLLDLFLGRTGGSMGEVSALALLLGGAYLVWRRVIKLRIPLTYLGTVAVLTLIFSRGQDHLLWMLYQLLSGGLLLGAIFMASDYATSPATPGGQVLYGVGCGVLTVVFRYTGLYPEGVTYAILLMNAGSWLLERFTPTRLFGAPQRKGGLR